MAPPELLLIMDAPMVWEELWDKAPVVPADAAAGICEEGNDVITTEDAVIEGLLLL